MKSDSIGIRMTDAAGFCHRKEFIFVIKFVLQKIYVQGPKALWSSLLLSQMLLKGLDSWESVDGDAREGQRIKGLLETSGMRISRRGQRREVFIHNRDGL